MTATVDSRKFKSHEEKIRKRNTKSKWICAPSSFPFYLSKIKVFKYTLYIILSCDRIKYFWSFLFEISKKKFTSSKEATYFLSLEIKNQLSTNISGTLMEVSSLFAFKTLSHHSINGMGTIEVNFVHMKNFKTILSTYSYKNRANCKLIASSWIG